MADEQLTEGEKEQMRDLLGYGSNLPDGKHNVHSFLHNVAIAEDTTKLGCLSKEEIGNLENPIRSYKFLAHFANNIMGKPKLKEFFNGFSEIGTSTSLSKDAILLKLAVTQKRELADITPKEQKENKSWFKKKEPKVAEPI